MKIEAETTIKLTLTLTEATWLQRVMQNPFYGQSLDEEAPIDNDMRSRFYTILTSANIKD